MEKLKQGVVLLNLQEGVPFEKISFWVIAYEDAHPLALMGHLRRS